jgi:hypothetical protein
MELSHQEIEFLRQELEILREEFESGKVARSQYNRNMIISILAKIKLCEQ